MRLTQIAAICALLLVSVLWGSSGSAPGATAMTVATTPIITAKGLKTAWQVTLVHVRSMMRIPNTTWAGYKVNRYRFYVLNLRVKNVGTQPADPLDDLLFVLKVIPPYPTTIPFGWHLLTRSEAVFINMATVAAREYGGVPPWTTTAQGATTQYCVVIPYAPASETHLGLYNDLPYKRSQFLASLGV